jgi:hypothetical protein
VGRRWVGTSGWATLVVAAVVLAGGCSQTGPTTAGATVPTVSTTSSSTTTAPESFAVPAEESKIDAAYAERVLNALKHVSGEVVRRIHARRAFDQSDLVILRAIYNDPELAAQAKGYRGLVAKHDAERDPPGDNTVSVTRLIGANLACIAVAATVDVSATVKDPPPPYTTFYVLRLTQQGANPDGINPTPWSIATQDDAKELTCAGP